MVGAIVCLALAFVAGCGSGTRSSSSPRGATASEVAIVRDGRSAWTIAVPERPTEGERFAAEELSKYLAKMTGATLPVRAEKVTEGPAIVVAERGHMTGFDEVEDMPAALEGEAYAIGVRPGRVYLVGARPRAVLGAVYAFLESQGCRFLAPELSHYRGTGEFVPKKADVVARVTRGAVVSAPAMAFRKLYVEEGHSHDEASLKSMAEWMPKAGYNTLVIPTDYQGSGRVKWDNWREAVGPELKKRDVTIEVGGHGYQNFLNAAMEEGKLFERHPEWFGADDKGTRRKAKQWVFCTSNRDAVQYLTRNFLAYVKERPEIEIYDFWPPDGAEWCRCGACAKLGTPSDRQAILVNHVMAQAAKVRADLRIEVLAYHTSITPPENQVVDAGILLDFCPISQRFDHYIYEDGERQNAAYVAGLRAWREKFAGEISIYSYYRKYAWDSLPVLLPDYMRREVQWYVKLPAQGISSYAEPGDWFTYELNHYLLGRLAWNPEGDVERWVGEFAEGRYGEHAEVGRAALRALEETVRFNGSVPYSTLKPADENERAWRKVKAAREAVDRAALIAKQEGVRYNLRRLSLVCGYAERDLAIQTLRAKGGDKEEMRRLARALYRFLADHGDEGVFLMRGGRLSEERILSHYDLGERPARGFAATTRGAQ